MKIINVLHKSMGPGYDQTHDPWISNRTRYKLPYVPGTLYFFLKVNLFRIFLKIVCMNVVIYGSRSRFKMCFAYLKEQCPCVFLGLFVSTTAKGDATALSLIKQTRGARDCTRDP